SVDFSKRRLSLVQPSTHWRRHGIEVDRLDAGARARLKEELFGRHLETLDIDGHGQDQLTCELKHFIHCVRTGAVPRVSGSDAAAAVVLADRILDSLRRHRWEGAADGPAGPHHIPAPLGALFQSMPQEGAA